MPIYIKRNIIKTKKDEASTGVQFSMKGTDYDSSQSSEVPEPVPCEVGGIPSYARM